MAKKLENLKSMDKGILEKILLDLRESLRVLKFNAEGAKSKNVKEALSLRRQIARVLTEISKNNKKK